jgi:hypothetical protein
MAFTEREWFIAVFSFAAGVIVVILFLGDAYYAAPHAQDVAQSRGSIASTQGPGRTGTERFGYAHRPRFHQTAYERS